MKKSELKQLIKTTILNEIKIDTPFKLVLIPTKFKSEMKIKGTDFIVQVFTIKDEKFQGNQKEGYYWINISPKHHTNEYNKIIKFLKNRGIPYRLYPKTAPIAILILTKYFYLEKNKQIDGTN